MTRSDRGSGVLWAAMSVSAVPVSDTFLENLRMASTARPAAVVERDPQLEPVERFRLDQAAPSSAGARGTRSRRLKKRVRTLLREIGSSRSIVS
jgi:hypothetical protein